MGLTPSPETATSGQSPHESYGYTKPDHLPSRVPYTIRRTTVTVVDISASPIAGAWVLTPRQYGDDRGTFLEWFRADHLEAATGRPFLIRQANHSVSARGVVRGVHFADVPPGQAKLVYCPRGAVLDVIVDVRAGSPTYGEHVAVRLDDVDRRCVFIAEGLGHAFVALSDDTSVTYLTSSTYDPAVERAVSPVDPALALPWPFPAAELTLSPKDLAAPTLAAALADGVLPAYDDCPR
ncbi:MAG: dTDP-4-dehydrorhamnose 3,5-epimerase [Frankiaceae bacterium]|nr:dTDP-4-dehydrorhamnose 3,5-epimerase [Frankiaceae bacterium]